jgi:hypothetical protein
MSLGPRRPFPHAYPRPWKVAHVDAGYIALNTTQEPIVEVCLVPTDQGSLQAEHTAALIELRSQRDAAGRSVRS